MAARQNLAKIALYAAAAGVLAVALGARASMLPFRSLDYEICLSRWYDQIKDHGGFRALNGSFYDYPVSYMYLLYLATLLPLEKVVAIKVVSLGFDFLLAFFAAKIVAVGRPHRPSSAVATFFAMLFAPSVVINGAYWGQCDAIYASFALAMLWLVAKGEGFRPSLALGACFSFKLQSVFLFPAFGIFVCKRPRLLKGLVLIPFVYVLSVLPAWLIAGRPLKDLLFIYAKQAGSTRDLTLSAPNLYQFFHDVPTKPFAYLGVSITGFVLLTVALLTIHSRQKLTPDLSVTLTLQTLIVVPFFLPGMHERYFFLADVVSVVYAFYFPRRFWLPIAVVGASTLSYSPFLAKSTPVPLAYLAGVMALALLTVTWDLVRQLYPVYPGRRRARAAAIGRRLSV